MRFVKTIQQLLLMQLVATFNNQELSYLKRGFCVSLEKNGKRWPTGSAFTQEESRVGDHCLLQKEQQVSSAHQQHQTRPTRDGARVAAVGVRVAASPFLVQ